jgi:3'-phosphoadenosine 5'-phosphosulfate sulfotransferase (PAPS reductase)/FAD synthetase
MTKHVALCSGGTDSVAATHAAMTWGPAEEVWFLNTRTGPPDARSAIDATIEWLHAWTDRHGWPLRVLDAPQSFAEIVREEGYPGPGVHLIMYVKCKERCIQAANSDIDADLHLWTGIRRHESENRMEVAEPEGEHGNGKWWWHSPLVDWTDEEVEDYLATFDLEPAPVVREVGRSCDCWCGAFGEREELIDLAAAGFEEHAEWLDSLTVPDDATREQSRWGGYNWDKSDWAAEDTNQTTLCSSCSAPASLSDLGGADDD